MEGLDIVARGRKANVNEAVVDKNGDDCTVKPWFSNSVPAGPQWFLNVL